jgi:hypothetical protein
MFAPDTSWSRSQRASEVRENLDSRRIRLIKLGSRRMNEVMANLNLLEPARGPRTLLKVRGVNQTVPTTSSRG